MLQELIERPNTFLTMHVCNLGEVYDDFFRLRDEIEILRQRQHDGHLEELRRFRADGRRAVRGEEGGDLLLRAEGNRLLRQVGRGARQEEVRVLRHGGIFSEEQVVAEERDLLREITRPQQCARRGVQGGRVALFRSISP